MNKLSQLKKKQLRKKVLAERLDFEDQFIRISSENILEKLKTLDFLEKKKVVHIYLPIKDSGEIDTWGIADWLQSSGCEVWTSYLPSGVAKDGFCNISANTTYDIGRYGIPLPLCKVESRCSPDVVIVPCLAVDKSGNRLGYGSGWYDKFLSKNMNATRVGLVYGQFLFEEIPHDANDRQLDIVLSDQKVLKFNRSQ